MRKEANDTESYVLSPSQGSASLAGLETVLSDYGGPPLAGPVDGKFDLVECKEVFSRTQVCKEGHTCFDWGKGPAPREQTELAYAAALLAGEADLADHMALSVFPVDQVSAYPYDEPPSDGHICPRAASCFNPTIDDPAGWCCDCMAKMMRDCNGVDQACFRSNMCAHTKVSKAWKEQNECSQQQIENGCAECQEAQEQEGDTTNRLKDRAGSLASKSETEASNLDEALEDKCSSGSR